MISHMKIVSILFFCLGSLGTFALAEAADGNRCNLNSNVVTPGCWLDLTAFLKTEFDYTDPVSNKRYTLSANIESPRNTGSSAAFVSTGSMILNQDCTVDHCRGKTVQGKFGTFSAVGASLPDYWASVKYAYFKSPQYPGIIFFSKMQSPFYTPEIFRYDTTTLNSMYVLSEPRFNPNQWAGYWQNPGGNVYFSDRGYFWGFTFFPINPVGGGVWRSSLSKNPLAGGLAYNLGGYKTPLQAPTGANGYWLHQPSFEGHVSTAQVAYADFYPSKGNDWYNYQPIGVDATQADSRFPKTGNLPKDLHVLILTTATLDINGVQTWMERYFYGIRPNGEAFGMIGYDNFIYNSNVCPNDWRADKVNYPAAVCWGKNYRNVSFQFNRLKNNSEFLPYVDTTNGTTYSLTSSQDFLKDLIKKVNEQVHNPKFSARTPNSPDGNVVDQLRPHLRGAFRAPGNGADYNHKFLSQGSIVGLESNVFVHDFYVYPGGTDPYVVKGTQCRQSYSYQGSMVVDEMWSGLDRKNRQGSGWAVFCNTSSDIFYLGGATCAPGYATRGYFYSKYDSYVRNAPTSNFYHQGANQWVNLCVKGTQAILRNDL